MKHLKSLCIIGLALLAFTAAEWARTDENMTYPQEKNYLIDDFQSENVASMGTVWRMFTDRVMGGLSNGTANYEIQDDRRCLRLRGDVSLENNGGFIQVALPLEKSGIPFDASEYAGVRATVKGNGEDYYIHLRTTRTRRPWQYYGAPFSTTGNWQTIDIAFSLFKAENLSFPLDTKELQRIAVVGIKKEFRADIAIDRLEFYR